MLAPAQGALALGLDLNLHPDMDHDLLQRAQALPPLPALYGSPGRRPLPLPMGVPLALHAHADEPDADEDDGELDYFLAPPPHPQSPRTALQPGMHAKGGHGAALGSPFKGSGSAGGQRPRAALSRKDKDKDKKGSKIKDADKDKEKEKDKDRSKLSAFRKMLGKAAPLPSPAEPPALAPREAPSPALSPALSPRRMGLGGGMGSGAGVDSRSRSGSGSASLGSALSGGTAGTLLSATSVTTAATEAEADGDGSSFSASLSGTTTASTNTCPGAGAGARPFSPHTPPTSSSSLPSSGARSGSGSGSGGAQSIAPKKSWFGRRPATASSNTSASAGARPGTASSLSSESAHLTRMRSGSGSASLARGILQGGGAHNSAGNGNSSSTNLSASSPSPSFSLPLPGAGAGAGIRLAPPPTAAGGGSSSAASSAAASMSPRLRARAPSASGSAFGASAFGSTSVGGGGHARDSQQARTARRLQLGAALWAHVYEGPLGGGGGGGVGNGIGVGSVGGSASGASGAVLSGREAMRMHELQLAVAPGGGGLSLADYLLLYSLGALDGNDPPAPPLPASARSSRSDSCAAPAPSTVTTSTSTGTNLASENSASERLARELSAVQLQRDLPPLPPPSPSPSSPSQRRPNAAHRPPVPSGLPALIDWVDSVNLSASSAAGTQGDHKQLPLTPEMGGAPVSVYGTPCGMPDGACGDGDGSHDHGHGDEHDADSDEWEHSIPTRPSSGLVDGVGAHSGALCLDAFERFPQPPARSKRAPHAESSNATLLHAWTLQMLSHAAEELQAAALAPWPAAGAAHEQEQEQEHASGTLAAFPLSPLARAHAMHIQAAAALVAARKDGLCAPFPLFERQRQLAAQSNPALAALMQNHKQRNERSLFSSLRSKVAPTGLGLEEELGEAQDTHYESALEAAIRRVLNQLEQSVSAGQAELCILDDTSVIALVQGAHAAAAAGGTAAGRPRIDSLEAHALLNRNEGLLVPDASQDVRFASKSTSKSAGARTFFAAVPILNPLGLPIALVTLASQRPVHSWTAASASLLEYCAGLIDDKLEAARREHLAAEGKRLQFEYAALQHQLASLGFKRIHDFAPPRAAAKIRRRQPSEGLAVAASLEEEAQEILEKEELVELLQDSLQTSKLDVETELLPATFEAVLRHVHTGLGASLSYLLRKETGSAHSIASGYERSASRIVASVGAAPHLLANLAIDDESHLVSDAAPPVVFTQVKVEPSKRTQDALPWWVFERDEQAYTSGCMVAAGYLGPHSYVLVSLYSPDAAATISTSAQSFFAAAAADLRTSLTQVSDLISTRINSSPHASHSWSQRGFPARS